MRFPIEAHATEETTDGESIVQSEPEQFKYVSSNFERKKYGRLLNQYLGERAALIVRQACARQSSCRESGDSGSPDRRSVS